MRAQSPSKTPYTRPSTTRGGRPGSSLSRRRSSATPSTPSSAPQPRPRPVASRPLEAQQPESTARVLMAAVALT
eukprot:scaffold12045_cov109-Isochrysis_galbana.AAC.4